MAEENEVVSDKTLDEEMGETIRSTLKDIEARGETGLEATETPAEPKADERAREPDGKFAKAQKESAAPAEQPDKTPKAGAVEQAAAETPAEPVAAQSAAPAFDIARPPSSWKPAAKAAWTALPEPVRAEIYRREGDFHKGNSAIRETADFGQKVRTTIEPYRMLIEAEGGTPEKAIADTMRTAALFRVGTPQQKLDAIFAIDKQFNVGLGTYIQSEFNRLAGAQGQPAPQQQPAQFQDPRVDQLLAKMQEREREQAAISERATNGAIETFMAAKNDKGEDLYPFVDNVLDDMSARVSQLRRLNPSLDHLEALKQAYDAAVWANPETRQVLISQQQATANQPQETLRKLEQAKRASAVNVPRRGAIAAKAPDSVLRFGTPESDESIRETYRQLTG